MTIYCNGISVSAYRWQDEWFCMRGFKKVKVVW